MTSEENKNERQGQSRSTAVLAMVLVVMLLMLCGLATFYVLVVNPPKKAVEVQDEDTEATMEVLDTYYGFGEVAKDRFNRPHDVAVAPNGDIIVADMGNRRLVRLNRSGRLVSQLQGGVWGAGKVDSPVGVDVGEDGRFYVADRGFNGPHGKVVILAADMKTVQKEIFFQPEDFPITPRVEGNEVYVTSASGVHVFDLEGKALRTWGGTIGKKAGQFTYPNGIVKLADGRVVVTDSNNRRLQFFDQRGKFLSAIGTPPVDMKDLSVGTFSLPMGIATDEDGLMYVVDSFAYGVRLLQPDGKQIVKLGDFGSGEGRFYNPGGIVRETGRTFLVADELNNRIVRLRFDVPAKYLPGGGKASGPVLTKPNSWVGPWCFWCLPLLLLLLLVAYVLWRLRKRSRDGASPSDGSQVGDSGQSGTDNLP